MVLLTSVVTVRFQFFIYLLKTQHVPTILLKICFAHIFDLAAVKPRQNCNIIIFTFVFDQINLDFELSDECNDFITMRVFFLNFFFVSSSFFRTVKIHRFSSTVSFSDRKANLIGNLGGKIFLIIFPSAGKKKRKIEDKLDFL